MENGSNYLQCTYLVGVRTKAKSLWGLSSNVWSIGKANAPVLPEPVSAKPIMSFSMLKDNKINDIKDLNNPQYSVSSTNKPCNARGMHSCWIFVGFFHPTFSHASHSISVTPWIK